MSPLETILERAPGARKSGDGWSDKCPAHKDTRASLSITEGADKRVLLHCFAGCTFSAIVAAYGLEEGDLFPPKDTTGKRIAAEYSYTDESGAELFQAVRFEPKDFRQRHRLAGEWVWNLNGMRRVLYRLPEVLEGIKAGATIWNVEGEKDVEALRSLGLVATCNPMGAGKWRPEFAEAFRGARVVKIIADRDGPGRKHAADVAASIPGAVIVEVPTGKDASDYIAAGATAEDFGRLKPVEARQALATFSGQELEKMDIPEPRYACARLVIEGLSLLAGSPKAGKSWLSLQLAVAVVTGGTWLGETCERGEVLYLALEDSQRRLKSRQRIVLDRHRCPPGLHFSIECPRLDADAIALISAWLDAHPDARLVIIDTLGRVKPLRKRGEDVYATDCAALSLLQALAFKYHVAVVAVTHTRKQFADDILEQVSGSFGLTGTADSVFVLKRGRFGADGDLSITGRDIEERDLVLSFTRGTLWALAGDKTDVPVTQERRDVVDVLHAAGRDSSRSPALGTGEIAKALGKGTGAVSKLLTRMSAEGHVYRGTKYGTWLPGSGSLYLSGEVGESVLGGEVSKFNNLNKQATSPASPTSPPSPPSPPKERVRGRGIVEIPVEGSRLVELRPVPDIEDEMDALVGGA